MSFHHVLKRLRGATESQSTRVTVDVSDVRELLRDYDRIDAIHRDGHARWERCSQACAVLQGEREQYRELAGANAEQLIRGLEDEKRLRAALMACSRGSSAAEVGLIVDEALATTTQPVLEALRKRFSVIEDEVARGKHSAMSCFTAMRTAALYTDTEPAQVNRISALDEHLRYILGRPNFWCHHLANALRAMGHEIARKAEEEQAAVIHWLLNAYFEHGPGWREAVQKILAAEREKELAKGGESPTCDFAQVSKVAEKAGQ